MAKKRTMGELRRAIRTLNARFRKIRNPSGGTADRIAERKDALIDEMQRIHRHRVAYETAGSPSNGPMGLGGGPQRFCIGCGLVDQPSAPDGYRLLGAVRAVNVTHDEYLAEQGKRLRALGINIA